MNLHLREIAKSLAATAMLALATSASAVTLLTLQAEPPQTLGPQSTSAPCIIAGTQCQNPAGFAYTNFIQQGNITAYDEDSPIYTVSQLPFLQFDVAIDVNTASGGETLLSFELFNLTTNTLLYQYTGPTLIGDPLPNNGNGYGDWSLRTFDLSGLAPTDQIQFSAEWNNTSDGAESFFLVSTAPIPEPETYALMLAGLGAVGFMSRRRRKA